MLFTRLALKTRRLKLRTKAAFDIGDVVVARSDTSAVLWVRWADNEWRSHSENDRTISDARMMDLLNGNTQADTNWTCVGNLFGVGDVFAIFQVTGLIGV